MSVGPGAPLVIGTKRMVALTCYSMIGNTVLVAQPMVVGALVDTLHFSERQAGFVASSELFGFAFGSALLLWVVHRVNLRALAISGVVIVVLADAIACCLSTPPAMLVVRFVAGMGAASAFAIYPVLAASSRSPEKVFGIVNAMSIAYAGAFVWAAPRLLRAWGLLGIFLTMAIFAVLVSPTLRWIPRRSPASRTPHAPGTSSEPGQKFDTNIILLLAVILLLYIGHGAIWAFQERIGVAAGLARQRVGDLLGSSMLIWGVGGSLLAGVLGLAIGRIWPQVISLGSSLIAAILLVAGQGPYLFGIACALIAAGWFYGLPYQIGLLALFDPKGRANIAGVLMSTTGAALGPSLAAILIVYGGHLAIGALAGGCYGICLALVLTSIARLERVQ